ncbi:benzoate/H(+) symporter BenE family transporter [uncultured Enterovirga sp.]|uniref:benzoate/H(+) symporter BenE family transporter n=1 Tax=uncultured Enterovirga sp. TaxID=2026352 RepID=UPI0035C9681A
MSDAVPRDSPAGSLIQPLSAGLLVGIVGYASTFALVLKGLQAVGATQEQAASGLLAILVVKGLLAIGLSLRTRMPISIAWSTPGAALLIATGVPEGGFPVAVGAFLVVAGLVVAAGLWSPFGRAVAAIPITLASAMLGGILFGLCTAPVRAVATLPALALPVVVVWALALRFARPYAVPLAVLLTGIVVAVATPVPAGMLADLVPHPIAVMPRFTLDAVIGIAIPLFVVTMASQNVPGLAVLHANGYRPSVGMLFVSTGIASALSAVFGGHTVNLAAITAALCAGPEAHPDPARRYVAGVTAGATYVALGLLASFAAAFVAASPPLLIESVAGLALLGSLAGALQTALSREDERLPAIVTFVTAASGTTFFGIGSAFWGLVAGGLLLAILRSGPPVRS